MKKLLYLACVLAIFPSCVSFRHDSSREGLQRDTVLRYTLSGADCPFADFAEYGLWVPGGNSPISGIMVLQHGCTMEQFGITKPYDLYVLKARIEAQLRRNVKPSPQHPKIELPELTVDLFAGTATLDGNEYSLPQRELQILYMLASQIGSRISYHDIYKTIYGCDVEDSKNTIRVNISRLKKHLNMDDMSTYEIAATSEGEYVLRRVIF